jgi:hypothetical protein
MLVVLGLAAPLHTPDLQVEVVTASGTPLPELAEAVSRALVAGGARVVLRGPTSGSCEYCGLVKVIESAPGVCDVEVRHEQHVASTKLHLPAGSQLFDRARAIAIQARLLMTWQNPPESKAKDVATHPAPRSAVKVEPRPWQAQTSNPGGRSPGAASPSRPEGDSLPYLATRREPSAPLASPAPIATAPAPVPSPFVAELARPVEAAPLVSYTASNDGRPAPRPAESKPPARSEAKPVVVEAAAPRPEAKPIAEARANPPRKPTSDATIVQSAMAPSARRWPWIPTAIGAGAAIAAGISAGISRGHYNALEDKGQPLANARSEKSAGEKWQTASLVLAGVAAIAVGTGIVGFVTGSSDAGQVRAMATPIPGGGMVALAGSLP